MISTKLNLQEKLSLTCSRAGTCCHGNQVLLNPWELYCLAREKKISPKEFRNLYCDFAGIRLKFDGKEDLRGKKSCSQYIENFGCSLHLGRPLACRLFPLGRQIQSEKVNYIFQGTTFPCLDGCPEVVELPQLTVEEYLKGQETENFETAQDAYLEIMQNIADIAFELLLDTELANSGEKETLKLWRKMGTETPDELAERIGTEWLDLLMIPEIISEFENPQNFTEKHYNLIQEKAQEKFGDLQSMTELQEASVLMMAIALLLAKAIGADPQNLADHWVETAKSFGAKE